MIEGLKAEISLDIKILIVMALEHLFEMEKDESNLQIGRIFFEEFEQKKGIAILDSLYFDHQ